MTPQDLQTIAVWSRELTPAEVEHAAPSVRLKRYQRGEHVAHLNDVVDAWHGAIEGVLRVGLVSDAGQVAGFSAILGGGWFGEGALMKAEPRRYDVVAVTDATVAVMRGDTFRWLTANSVGFNRYLVQLLNERLGQFIATVSSDRTGGASARLAHTIVAMFNPVLFPRTGPDLVMPQEELGIFAGLSRQMTNRALRELAAAGLIEVTGNGVRVLKLAALQSWGAEAAG